MSYLVRKIKAYFELGVRSCWLVIPSTGTINVYKSSHKKPIPFNLKDIELIDEVMDIHLPMQKIFNWQ